jgi:hypothetical protein
MMASAHTGAIRSAITSHRPTPQGRSASTHLEVCTNSNCEKAVTPIGIKTPSRYRRLIRPASADVLIPAKSGPPPGGTAR